MEEEKKTAGSQENMSSPAPEKNAAVNPSETKTSSVTPEEKEAADVSAVPQDAPKADSIDGNYRQNKRPASENIVFLPVKYVNDGTRTIDEDMERVRKTFVARLGKAKIFNIAAGGIMILAFIGIILVTFLNTDTSRAWITWTVLGIAVALIIAAFSLAAFFNKKNAKVSAEYLGVYQDMVNGYTLSGLKLNDERLCPDGKIDDQLIIQAHYFETISEIQSRAFLTASRNGRDFSVGEVAVLIAPVTYDKANGIPTDMINPDGTPYVPSPIEDTGTQTQELSSTDMTQIDLNLNSEANGSDKEQKKREKDEAKAEKGTEAAKKDPNSRVNETTTGLFGKYYSYDCPVTSDEAIIVTFLGDRKNSMLPTFLTGFHPVHISGLRKNIVVYATNPQKSAKFFDEGAIKILNGIVPDMDVQSAFLSINSYGAKVGFFLSDNIMALPMKPATHLGSYDSLKRATESVFAFFDSVDAKKEK